MSERARRDRNPDSVSPFDWRAIVGMGLLGVVLGSLVLVLSISSAQVPPPDSDNGGYVGLFRPPAPRPRFCSTTAMARPTRP